ncbi:MAG: fumarylacetoacetate hydrolase family protein [Methanobacteriota archaeon]|nr:MAG: fumarylacetoacetate hydrolase family protein [Euryarchaeota archaeon]
MSKPEALFGKFRAGNAEFVGRVVGDEVIELSSKKIIDVIEGGASEVGRTHAAGDLRTLPPVDMPSKIICVGLNYRSHIREMKWETPTTPIIFMKPSSAIVGQGDGIVLPSVSSRVDYEGESAVIIGKKTRNAVDGVKAIFGYTCFNDVTARDLQKHDPDWTRSKGFDTFAPIGPYLSREAPSRVTTRLNGNVVQKADMSDRVFDDAALVEYVSGIMTLEPGDVIATGTPSGISPIRAGDIVEVEVDGIGTLRNPVTSDEEHRGGR